MTDLTTSDPIECKKCCISADEVRMNGELVESLLIGVIGYCLTCCPKKKLINLAEVIKQELNQGWMH
jgi:hypothetical protein